MTGSGLRAATLRRGQRLLGSGNSTVTVASAPIQFQRRQRGRAAGAQAHRMPRPVSVANDPERRGCSRPLCRCCALMIEPVCSPAGQGTAARRNPSLKREVRHATPCATPCTVRAAEEAGMRDWVVAGSSGGRSLGAPRLAGSSIVLAAGSCPVPDYVPPLVRAVLPWARQHVARVSARYGIGIEDLWNEAIAALLRVSIHRAENAHEIRGCDHYCRTAVHRACWRYVVRDHVRRQRHGTRVALEDVAQSAELTAPSAEAEAIACDAARRAFILREHAALAAARGDYDTTSRLCTAASAADRLARRRHTRRR